MKLIKNNVVYETNNPLTIEQMLKYGAKVYKNDSKKLEDKPVKKSRRKR